MNMQILTLDIADIDFGKLGQHQSNPDTESDELWKLFRCG